MNSGRLRNWSCFCVICWKIREDLREPSVNYWHRHSRERSPIDVEQAGNSIELVVRGHSLRAYSVKLKLGSLLGTISLPWWLSNDYRSSAASMSESNELRSPFSPTDDSHDRCLHEFPSGDQYPGIELSAIEIKDRPCRFIQFTQRIFAKPMSVAGELRRLGSRLPGCLPSQLVLALPGSSGCILRQYFSDN